MNRLTSNQSISMESMRGTSAILVVICHSFQIFIARYAPDYFNYIVMIAQSSVMVFFVLSGFLIGKSIQYNINQNDCFDLSKYTQSRIKRIYPPLILSIILVYVFAFLAPYVFETKSILMSNPDSWLKNTHFDFSSNQVISAITFTNGILPTSTPFNTPLWSLPLEVWYYVIAGFIFTKKPLLIVLSACLFLLISSAKYEFFIYSFIWFFGLCTSKIKTNSKIAMLFYLFLLFVFSFLSFKYGCKYNSGTNTIHYYNLFFGLFFCCLMYICVLRLNKKISIFPSASRYSYTLYLIHIPIMIFITGIFESHVLVNYKHSILLSILSIVLSVLLAFYSAKIVENKHKINVLLSTE